MADCQQKSVISYHLIDMFHLNDTLNSILYLNDIFHLNNMFYLNGYERTDSAGDFYWQSTIKLSAGSAVDLSQYSAGKLLAYR